MMKSRIDESARGDTDPIGGPDPKRPKKPYVPLALVEYGTLAQLTLLGIGSGLVDCAEAPNDPNCPPLD